MQGFTRYFLRVRYYYPKPKNLKGSPFITLTLAIVLYKWGGCFVVQQVYKMIFEQDPPCMLKVAMEALIDIADWYASPSSTFIRMYKAEKPLHVLSKFSLDKLVMQELSYHISAGL